jgi:hypothetical protein
MTKEERERTLGAYPHLYTTGREEGSVEKSSSVP